MIQDIHIDPVEFDVIVYGTGLHESLVAAYVQGTIVFPHYQLL
jgi:RAB protein geranylgeranyltransferase component A